MREGSCLPLIVGLFRPRPLIEASEFALRLILPMSFTYLHISLWVKRVIDPAALARCLADNQQPHITFRIVEKCVGNAGARRKAHAVTRLQMPEMSVKPNIRCPFDNIHKLLFIGLRMWPGNAGGQVAGAHGGCQAA